jgi:hypothetical protein
MSEESFKLVKDSLSHHRRTTTPVKQTVPTQQEIDELFHERITPETDLPPMQPLFKMFDVPCFYRGELVADCGKAKSGKTFFLSILMSACLSGETLALKRHTEIEGHTETTEITEMNPLKVLWIDTEQSQQSTQEILRDRIIPLTEKSVESVKSVCDINETFYAFNLRGLGYEKRERMVDVAIRTLKPDIVIIDGIKDLMTDINDAVQATFLMEKMMALAKDTNSCIVCVLHLNKAEQDRNMRGSIGTELTNKAFEVFQCDVIEDTSTFKVTHTYSRKRKMKRKFYYHIDEQGLPVVCANFQEQPRDNWGRFASKKPRQTVTSDVKWDTFNQDYILHEEGSDCYEWDLRELFEDAMEGRSSRPFKHFMGASLKLSHIVDPNYFYQLVDEGISKKIISREQHPTSKEEWIVFHEETLFNGTESQDGAPF